PAGRPGEPWVWVVVRTGSQLRVSQRDWPGMYKPEQIGLTAWKFTKQFGTHLPGGGISDPADIFDPDAHWEISGGLEINCLACHNACARQDMTEWAKQIARENFRWAATAASGLGEVGGMASRMPVSWNIYAGFNPDDRTYAVPPSVNYSPGFFTSTQQAWFDIGKPADARCLHCHSAHPAKEGRMEIATDVHSAVGIGCVACHRNELDHDIQRGTEKTAECGCQAAEEMSCRACHLDNGSTPGKLGAPIAHHKGIPPIHFEKLSCTACHSGQEAASIPTVVRTSRANKLGIYGRAQWFTESPFIVEPVFVKGDAGKIEPHRMMWPAFWATVNGENLQPLEPAQVETADKGILDAQQQVATLLSAIGGTEGAPGYPVYAAGGKLYERNTDGGLDLVQTSENVPAGTSWLWKTKTNIVSTIPDFDANAEELDYDAEGAILAVMDAMSSQANGRALVVAVKGKLLTRHADGYIERADTQQAQGWYWKDGDKLTALVSEFAERAITDIVGTDFAFNEEQAAMMLKALSQALEKPVAYVSNGRKFSLADDGSLADEDHPATAPVSWAIAHNVRPAAKSLGVKKCAECHSAKADFFFGSVAATGPLKTDRMSVKSMHEFQDVSKGFHKLFGMSFLVRSLFKTVMGGLALLIAAAILIVGLLALNRAMQLLGSKNDERMGLFPKVEVLVIAAVFASIAFLAITGFLFGWCTGHPLGGYALLGHTAFGGLYAAALCALVLLRGRSTWFTPLRKTAFWVLLASGLMLVLSILMAMFPIFGTHGQHMCIVLHRIAALLTLPALAVLALGMFKKPDMME
ncbi:MAG: cytochrome c3 family protein, partial [Kiritimatiellales bacterium]|nr:cytochrome c3 family protein [Kiritimatiellales bacterium]